jgi:hypothetical protein
MRSLAKNLVIRLETNLGSAAIGYPATIFNRTLGNPAGKNLLVKLLFCKLYNYLL